MRLELHFQKKVLCEFNAAAFTGSRARGEKKGVSCMASSISSIIAFLAFSDAGCLVASSGPSGVLRGPRG